MVEKIQTIMNKDYQRYEMEKLNQQITIIDKINKTKKLKV